MAKRAPAPNEDIGDLFGFQRAAKGAPKAEKPLRQKAAKAKVSPRIVASTQFFAVDEVAKRYGVSPATIWRWVSSNKDFPEPIKLSPGTSRWSTEQLLDFENNASKGLARKSFSRAQKTEGNCSKGRA